MHFESYSRLRYFPINLISKEIRSTRNGDKIRDVVFCEEGMYQYNHSELSYLPIYFSLILGKSTADSDSFFCEAFPLFKLKCISYLITKVNQIIPDDSSFIYAWVSNWSTKELVKLNGFHTIHSRNFLFFFDGFTN